MVFLALTLVRRSKTCLFLITFFLYPISRSLALKTCKHVVPKPDEVKFGVFLEQEHGGTQKRDVDQSLRIFTVYEGSVDQLSSVERELVIRHCTSGHVFRWADEPYEYCPESCSAISKCGLAEIPEEHLQACYVCDENGQNCHQTETEAGPGVADTDFILYVSSLDNEKCDNDTVGYAAYCQLEASTDRPIAGYVNLCPHILTMGTVDYLGLLATVKHEIFHALGFSVGLYAFYRDENGNPLTERDPLTGMPPFDADLNSYVWDETVVKSVVRDSWSTRNGLVEHEVQLLVTPKIVEEARAHFGCPTLEGIEIENQGGVGTALTHFEKRLLENEAMTGAHTQNRLFSRLTLSLMEDTGWYRANYDMADPLQWGKGLGCQFATGSCKEWIDERKRSAEPLDHFCDTIQAKPYNFTCSLGRVSVALCNLQSYQDDLPLEYQYFNSLPDVEDSEVAKYGGLVELADYCPFHQEISWKEDGILKTTRCDIAENFQEETDYSLQFYGENSVCLEQETNWRKETCDTLYWNKDWGSGCYKHECTEDGLLIYILDMAVQCSYQGQILSFSKINGGARYNGTLICPSCQELCQNCPQGNQATPSSVATAIDPEVDLCSLVGQGSRLNWSQTVSMVTPVLILFQNSFT